MWYAGLVGLTKMHPGLDEVAVTLVVDRGDVTTVALVAEGARCESSPATCTSWGSIRGIA